MTRPKLKIPEGVTVVSPSQINTAQQCWRKWAFQYIQGKRDPSGRGAAFGGVVHERHEAYLGSGVVPTREETWTFRDHIVTASDATRILRTISDSQLDKPMYPGRVMLNMMPKDIYPAPKSGYVEKHFVYKRTPVIWYQGLIDWHSYDRATRRLKIIDHKTSSNPQRYGLRTEAPEPDDDIQHGQLRADKQAVIYARAGLNMYQDSNGGPEAVDLYWNYGKSDGVTKHSYVAEAHYDNVGEVYARFENDVHPWAVEIHRLKMMGADPLTLDPNPSSCWLYNQECMHARACNLSTEQKMGALMTGNSLVQDLLSGNKAAAPLPGQGAPVASILPPPVPGDLISPPEAAGPVATAPPATVPVVPAASASVATPSGAPKLEVPANFWNAVAQEIVNQIPANFWNAIAQEVVNQIMTGLKGNLK